MTPKKIKVLGIDPGLAATGVGIVTGRGLKIDGYAYGAITTSQTCRSGMRLEKIYNRLLQIIKEEKPDLMVLEEAFSLEAYPKSGIALGKVCGVILLAGQQAGCTVKEVAVREAKQVLTGNGNAGKEQLEKAVRRALDCETPIRPYHASDALGLALIGLFRYGGYRSIESLCA
ncbi:MAG: crossover junction endodeoxyribonuclease RuvC [Desulfatitalea sp.]|nr:crossover junction endodeoxyribonuclease RuvC [Desulfatitalea sp.]NNK01574.1 crossover junction endodeoxyribonuclease RuvC [Desulfatitalea sp.]